MISLAGALLVFVAATTASGIFLSTVWGFLNSEIARFSIIAGVLVAAYAIRLFQKKKFSEPPLESIDRVAAFLLVLFCLKYFFWIYFYEDGYWKTFEIAEKELPVFLAKVNNFTAGQRFWPQNPVLLTEPYHDFGFAFFTGLLVRLGFPLTSLLPVFGFLAALILATVLLFWARWLAVTGFLVFSGTAGVILLLSNGWPSLNSFLGQETIFHSALPFMIFISEPKFLYVFPVGLLLLWSWRRCFLRSQDGLPGVIEVLLWGTLPLFHLHSFLLLSAVFLVWVAFGDGTRRGKGFLQAARVCLVALPLVAVQTSFFQDFFSLISLHFMEVFQKGTATAYLLKNYGFFFLCLVALAVGLSFCPQRESVTIFLPALLFYLVGITMEIGPWHGKNQEILAWCYLLFLPVFQSVVWQLFPLPGRLVLWTALCLPGIVLHLSDTTYLNKRISMVDAHQLQAVCQGLSRLPRDWRIATTMKRIHPVALCGYPVVTLFNDTTFLSGTSDRENSRQLRQLMAGGERWRERAKELGVRYVFWGKDEKEDFDHYSQKPWEQVAKTLRDESWGKIFDIGRPDPIAPVPAEGQGLQASFFANRHWQGEPVMIHRVPTLNFFWPNADEEILASSFSVLFEGEIFIPETGKITFYLGSDDGSELSIGKTVLIDHLGDHSFRIKGGSHYFEKGWYPFRVRYYNSWGVAALQLWWKLPSGKEDFIPPENFRPPTNVSP